jgi:hypothetical protein
MEVVLFISSSQDGLQQMHVVWNVYYLGALPLKDSNLLAERKTSKRRMTAQFY